MRLLGSHSIIVITQSYLKELECLSKARVDPHMRKLISVHKDKIGAHLPIYGEYLDRAAATAEHPVFSAMTFLYHAPSTADTKGIVLVNTRFIMQS